jgi:hypothetical protein
MRSKCGAAKPLVKAHSRFGSWLVTPAMRISMGLEPAVLCHFPAGHSGKHSWQVRYNDPALRLNWGNLFPNPHILEIPPPAPKPKPPQVVKDADHYRALSLKYAMARSSMPGSGRPGLRIDAALGEGEGDKSTDARTRPDATYDPCPFFSSYGISSVTF